ncbi:MAG: DUF4231 domain-containing protein [Chloroflexi bacterium]|uniref:DUF4231 domain-containing protein n=1 Tax=Candidatus Flexifilum breve TaxID=3140694 RepID=UPI0031376495|nr:DUF4231 domain-containing protein [Chloroflexota bacterium]
MSMELNHPPSQQVLPKTPANNRRRGGVLLQEMPYWRGFPPMDETFQLVSKEELRDYLRDEDPVAVREMESDVDFLEFELMRLFRERDYAAKLQQNRYRLYVIIFLLLAAFAAVFAVIILALLILMQLQLIPFVALFETIVALLGIFLTTISGREPPLQLWLSYRRRAEQLRREYFRYLFGCPL